MTTLILFHWLECGACIQFMPSWDDEILNKKNISSIKIEAEDKTIDQVKQKNMNTKLKDNELTKILEWKENVNGYPTICKWDGFKVIEYTGERNTALIIAWCNTKTGGSKKRYLKNKTFRKKNRKNRKNKTKRRNKK